MERLAHTRVYDARQNTLTYCFLCKAPHTMLQKSSDFNHICSLDLHIQATLLYTTSFVHTAFPVCATGSMLQKATMFYAVPESFIVQFN